MTSRDLFKRGMVKAKKSEFTVSTARNPPCQCWFNQVTCLKKKKKKKRHFKCLLSKFCQTSKHFPTLPHCGLQSCSCLSTVAAGMFVHWVIAFYKVDVRLCCFLWSDRWQPGWGKTLTLKKILSCGLTTFLGNMLQVRGGKCEEREKEQWFLNQWHSSVMEK